MSRVEIRGFQYLAFALIKILVGIFILEFSLTVHTVLHCALENCLQNSKQCNPMKIKKVAIKNYKSLQGSVVDFRENLSVLVADNEMGKSSVLEAINLALTCQLNGRHVRYDLHPFLFNLDATKTYLANLQAGEKPYPPSITIELYFENHPDLVHLKGSINSLKDDCPGLMFSVEFNEVNDGEYQKYIEDPGEVTAVPVEFLRVVWRSFKDHGVTGQDVPIKPVLIDATSIRHDLGANKYVVEEISRHLTITERAKLSLAYRKMKDRFLDDEKVKTINEELAKKTGRISAKTLTMGLDNTARARWEAGVMPHLDEIPFPLVGKGEQSSTKIRLALDAAEGQGVLLIEEPENHQSHTNLNTLLSVMEEHAKDNQLIVTTHNTFVLNKLGLSGVVLFDGKNGATLNELPPDTTEYFKKLSGHDTLRFILAKRVILVEGPSDELVVQKAYLNRYGALPLADGTEVITVNSLAFKRFLYIAQLLDVDVRVVTDNDREPEKVVEKYNEFEDNENISIHFDDDTDFPTLEPQLLKANDLATLNTVLGKAFTTDDELLAYMAANKTDCALKVFETDQAMKFPHYVENAISK